MVGDSSLEVEGFKTLMRVGTLEVGNCRRKLTGSEVMKMVERFEKNWELDILEKNLVS